MGRLNNNVLWLVIIQYYSAGDRFTGPAYLYRPHSPSPPTIGSTAVFAHRCLVRGPSSTGVRTCTLRHVFQKYRWQYACAIEPAGPMMGITFF